MFSNQLSKQAIYITVSGVQGTLKIIDTAMKYYLSSTEKSIRGKISLKELNKQKLQLKDIPLSSKDLKGMEKELKKWQIHLGLTFLYLKIAKGSKEKLGRPKIKPYEVKERLMQFINS